MLKNKLPKVHLLEIFAKLLTVDGETDKIFLDMAERLSCINFNLDVNIMCDFNLLFIFMIYRMTFINIQTKTKRH